MLLPSRGASIGSTCNSTTPVSSEVDERQNMGMLASPLFTQKREASAATSRINHSNKEISVSSVSHRETCCDVLTQEKVVPRSKEFTGVVFRERTFTEHREVRDFLNFEQVKPLKEKRLRYPNSLERDTIRENFLRNEGTRYCLKRDLRLICMN